MCNRDLVSTGRTTKHNRLGITNLALSYMMRNQFYFDKTFVHCLAKYYVLQWKPLHFLQAMHEGIITHDGVKYEVIFHMTTAKLIAYEGLTNKDSHVKLSFRLAYNEFSVPNTVLVKLYKQTLLT